MATRQKITCKRHALQARKPVSASTQLWLVHDTVRQKMDTVKLLLLRCRRFCNENARRTTIPTGVSIIHSTPPSTTAADAKSYNDISRWNIFTISHHLPGSQRIVVSWRFVNDQVDGGQSATLSTVENEIPFRTTILAVGTENSIGPRVDHVDSRTAVILLKLTLLQQTVKRSSIHNSRRV